MNTSSFENASPLEYAPLLRGKVFDRPLRAAIIGFGKVGAGDVDDPIMARRGPFATHAIVPHTCEADWLPTIRAGLPPAPRTATNYRPI